MTDFLNLAMSMPCDETLLAPLGRVHWAASRLRHGVRDAMNAITGVPSDGPFDCTLKQAVQELAKLAKARLVEPDRTRVVQWCQDVGLPAVDGRNGLAHPLTFTADDGFQAIGGSKPGRPRRYTEQDILVAAGKLVDASRLLPPGPYRTAP